MDCGCFDTCDGGKFACDSTGDAGEKEDKRVYNFEGGRNLYRKSYGEGQSKKGLHGLLHYGEKVINR